MRRRPLLLAAPASLLAAPTFLLAAPTFLLARAAGATPAQQVFRVVREGRDIGSHTIRVREEGNAIAAVNEMAIEVKLVGITVFRMSHVYEEQWQGGRLVAYLSRLDRNGTKTEMRGRAEGDALLLTLGAETRRLPGNAAPLGWWDSRRLGTRPLFDSDDGTPLDVRWTRRTQPDGGVECVATGAVEGTGRYAADNTWLAFRQKAEDGSAVEYRRQA